MGAKELIKEKQAEDVEDGLITIDEHYQEIEESFQLTNIDIKKKLDKVREQMEVSKRKMMQIEARRKLVLEKYLKETFEQEEIMKKLCTEEKELSTKLDTLYQEGS